MENESNKLVKGALVLTLSGLISKILSAGYRIPLQNLTGDMGFYIYQQVYPLLGMATVLALYGFPSAVSKLTADMKAKGRQVSFQHVYGPILLILLGINSVFFILLYMNAESLSVWIGDKHLVDTYKLAAFIFLFIPFTSTIRGVLQGYQYMQPTAYSQIGEKVVRVFLIIIAAYFIASGQGSIYQIGQAAGIAAMAGSLIALLILYFFYIKIRPKDQGQTIISWRFYIRTILLFGLVAALNHMILIIIQFADTMTFVPSLMNAGLNKLDAMQLKGIFDRGQPLIQVGTVFGSSFALALIPNLTKQNRDESPKSFYQPIQSAIKFSFYIAFAAMLGLILIFPETNTLLFKNAAGTISLRILAISILLSSLAITGTTILQGIGYLKRTASFIMIAFFIKWLGNQILAPFLEVKGAALATVLSLFVLCLIVLFELKRKLPLLSFSKSIRWRPFLIASSGMLVYIMLVKGLSPHFDIFSRIGLLGWILFVVLTGAGLYLFLLVRFGAFSKRELLMLPCSTMFLRLSKEE